eukprot:TRINITY_DN1403_c0_g1_i2.p1 TRINITY_DN1403_c0_g1~~TRINITY_DN1403_c0_g1_i2.p1  ORF type:complete len:359 (-),score=76.37 TRINITY_DN1403_c0_g1_i2:643-1719(-)
MSPKSLSTELSCARIPWRWRVNCWPIQTITPPILQEKARLLPFNLQDILLQRPGSMPLFNKPNSPVRLPLISSKENHRLMMKKCCTKTSHPPIHAQIDAIIVSHLVTLPTPKTFSFRYLIECNPRSTNGIHLFTPGHVLGAELVDSTTEATLFHHKICKKFASCFTKILDQEKILEFALERTENDKDDKNDGEQGDTDDDDNNDEFEVEEASSSSRDDKNTKKSFDIAINEWKRQNEPSPIPTRFGIEPISINKDHKVPLTPAEETRPSAVAAALVFFNLFSERGPGWRPDTTWMELFQELFEWSKMFILSRDVVFSPNDMKPSIHQFVAVAYSLWIAFTNGCDVFEASTIDIEWNGQ